MNLELEADREGVGDDALDEFLARERMLADGDGLERFVLLMRSQRGDPREEQGTDGGEVVLRDLLFGPVVILVCADDEFYFVRGAQVRDVLVTVARGFPTRRAFEIHDAAHTRVDL